MTIYDGVMAAILVAGMIRGAWRGITWQLASIGSLVLGYMFSYPVSAMIAPKIPASPEAARAASMAAAYVAVSSAVFGVAWMVRNVIRRLKFEAYDRHLGMMLGGVEGVAVGILGTMLVLSVAPSTRTPIFASPTGKAVNVVVHHVGPILPAEVRSALAPYWPKDDGTAADVADANEPEADEPADVEAVADAKPAPRDPEVRAVASRAVSRLDAEVGRSRAADAAEPAPAAATAEAAELPSARQVMDRLVEHGRRKAEQVVVESLDSDPEGKAGTLRELYEKDKARIQGALTDAVDETRRSLTGKVEDAVDETRRSVADQVQGRAGQLKGQAGQVQKRVDQYRAKAAQAQDAVVKARRRLEQGADGAIESGRKRLEQSLTDALDKGLDKLGLPEPAPAAPK